MNFTIVSVNTIGFIDSSIHGSVPIVTFYRSQQVWMKTFRSFLINYYVVGFQIFFLTSFHNTGRLRF